MGELKRELGLIHSSVAKKDQARAVVYVDIKDLLQLEGVQEISEEDALAAEEDEEEQEEDQEEEVEVILEASENAVVSYDIDEESDLGFGVDKESELEKGLSSSILLATEGLNRTRKRKTKSSKLEFATGPSIEMVLVGTPEQLQAYQASLKPTDRKIFESDFRVERKFLTSSWSAPVPNLGLIHPAFEPLKGGLETLKSIVFFKI